jgi:putative membrane protein
VSSPAETQAARTALSWQRTGLSLLLVAGLLARGAAVHGELLLVVPTSVVAVAALVVLGVLGPRRRRNGDVAARAGGDARAPRAAAAATGLTVLAALCALVAELLLRT